MKMMRMAKKVTVTVKEGLREIKTKMMETAEKMMVTVNEKWQVN